MCRFILDVNDEFGTTIVLIEHDIGVVMDLSDHVVVLDYGRKIADGTADGGARRPGGHRRLSRRRAAAGGIADGLVLLRRGADRRPARRRHVLARRDRLRADLQGVGRLQLRAGRDGLLRRADLRQPGREAVALRGSRSRRRSAAWWCSPSSIERFVLRPLVNQPPITLFMATLGLTFMIEGVAQGVLGRAGARPRARHPGHRRSRSGGINVSQFDLFAAAVAAVLVAVLALFFSKTRIGLALRAVADDQLAALAVGIPLEQIWVIVWAARRLRRAGRGPALGRADRACSSRCR